MTNIWSRTLDFDTAQSGVGTIRNVHLGLTPGTYTHLRARFAAHGSGSITIDNASIGVRANNVDTLATPWSLLQAPLTLPGGGGEIASGFVELSQPITISGGSGLISVVDYTGWTRQKITDANSFWHKPNASSYNLAAVSGFTEVAGRASVVAAIDGVLSAPPPYGSVVDEMDADNDTHIDLIDLTGLPCDHYALEFYDAVSDIETPPNAQSGALLTVYVSVDGGVTFDTGPHYFSTGICNFPGEANRYFLPPFALGLPQTLNMGFRLAADTGDTPSYGASGVADIWIAGGHTQYTSKAIKGAIGGNASGSMPAIIRPAQAAFSGYINGTTLTVNEAIFGTISAEQQLDCPGIAPNTLINALGSGTGGVGTYIVSVSQTVGQTMMKAVASTHPYFPTNGTSPFNWPVQIDYAGHYDGAPGQQPNAFRLKMNGGGVQGALIEKGKFKLRRMG